MLNEKKDESGLQFIIQNLTFIIPPLRPLRPLRLKITPRIEPSNLKHSLIPRGLALRLGGALLRLPGGCRLFNQAAAYDEALYLVRAFVYLRDLGVAHVLLDWIVLAVAVAAEELHGVGRDTHRHVGREDLAHSCYLRDVLGASVYG